MPLLAGDTGLPPGSLIIADGQIEWNGLLLGRGTSYAVAAILGWTDLPAVSSATTARPTRHGAWPGRHLAEPRFVTVEINMSAPGELPQAIADLEAATQVNAVERPLVIRLGGTSLMVWGRVLRRDIPISLDYGVDYLDGCAVQWECADPRRYELIEHELALPLPQPGPGTGWPWVWPVDWGLPGVSGAGTVMLDLPADTHPVITIRGPVTTPALTNHATGLALEYGITLGLTDVLAVDTYEGTVLLNGTANRLYTATGRSAPEESWVLKRGENEIDFRSGGVSDPDARAVLRYRAAVL